AQAAEVADLVDRQPVVEPLAPAVQLGIERPAGDPALRIGERERARLIAVDRDVPLLLECRRRLRDLVRERSAERAVAARARVLRGRGRSGRAAPSVRGRWLRHPLADGDHVRAVLTADLEDLAADAVVPDRIARLASVA